MRAPTTDTDRQQLAACFPWIAALDPAAREQLLRRLQRLNLPRGAMLFDAGAACTGFPLLVAGDVRVIKPGPEGREILLYRIAPGESCILTSSCLLGASDYSARAVVETPATMYVLPRGDFLELLGTQAGFRESVFHLFAERLTTLMSLVDAIAFHRLDQRLADRLLGHGSVIATSHQALALELGSVREIITRVLGEFAERGLVALSRGQIGIRDAAGLRQVATRGL